MCSDLSKGFDTFNQFKSAYGPAGTGKAWHHLVEQNTADSGLFVAKKVHHPDNLIPIKTEFNTFLNGLYSRNGQFPELGGLSLRNWLKTQPFEKHMEWGLKVYNENKHLFL